MQPAPHTPHARDDQAGGAPATGREMLWEVIELAGGFGAMLMPLLLLAVPGIALFVVLPAALVLLVAAIPVTIAAAAVGLPYLLVRAIRRQRATWRSWPPIRSSPRSSSTST